MYQHLTDDEFMAFADDFWKKAGKGEFGFDERVDEDRYWRLLHLRNNNRGSLPIMIIDKESPLKGGMKSTIDGKIYTNRNAWDNHLKANGSRQLEAGEGAKPRPMAGDYNCRQALTKATRDILRTK